MFSALLGRKNRLPLPLQSLPAVGRFALWAHTGAQGAALWKNLGRTCFRGTIFLYRPALRPAASRWDHKFSATGNLSSREPWGGRQHGLHRAKAAAHGLGNGAMGKRPLCTTLACAGWAGCPCSAPAANATCVKRSGAPDPECVQKMPGPQRVQSELFVIQVASLRFVPRALIVSFPALTLQLSSRSAPS